MRQIILINAGTKTKKAFASGLNSTSLKVIQSKRALIHLTPTPKTKIIYHNEEIAVADSYVFTRLRASDALFCGILYEHFAACGIPTNDPINFNYPHSEEKIAQMARFVRAGICIPDTLIVREESYISNRDYILEHISFPLIYKLDGSQGRNVHLVQNQTKLDALIAIKPRHERFLLQAYIPNTFDTRTIVAYGKILGTIKRTAQAGNFLNNVSQGASVEAYILTEEETKVALLATASAGLDFGGVDIIHTASGPVVLEVNKSPQINGFERVFGQDKVFNTIAHLIETKQYCSM